MTVLHMGALHPVETLLVLLLAFGPFLLLAVVTVIRRRGHDRSAMADAHDNEIATPAPNEDPPS